MEDKVALFVQNIGRRNVRESLAAIVVMLMFSANLLAEPRLDLGAIGHLVVILGSLAILAVIWGRLHIPPSELELYPPAKFQDKWRARMSTQAQTLRLAWVWYVLPLFAGFALIIIDRSRGDSRLLTLSLAIGGVLAFAVGMLNQAAAKKIEEDRDVWLAGFNAASSIL